MKLISGKVSFNGVSLTNIISTFPLDYERQLIEFMIYRINVKLGNYDIIHMFFILSMQ